MKPRVYIETTIPSYLAGRPSRDLVLAGQQQVTRDWWETQRAAYDLFVSELVIKEISRGDAGLAKARLALVEPLPVLKATEKSKEIAAGLVSEGLIPAVANPDAMHIGIAAVHGMDFLLTWNCSHLNNPHTIRRIELLCRQMGFPCPVICTPRELREIES